MEKDIEKIENDISEFAQLVIYFRLQQGMSQGQLAQATQLSRTYVYHLETGQRTNPSPQVVESIACALNLRSEERQTLSDAYSALTGQLLDQGQIENTLLDMGELASFLVQNTSYPAHSLDKLWYLHSWNQASILLFDVHEELRRGDKLHLLELVFDPASRKRFHGWENFACRLVSDFQYHTRTITHLAEYKSLWKQLREYPEFRRIASTVYPRGKPAPSFIFQIQHCQLGRLTLRTAMTAFAGVPNYSLVSYVPGDQRTLSSYRACGWQPVE
jgi:transcriptional regulator with XRE-family HTH domain